ncbi:ATP-binding protein, partial [Streptomyces resistomycificus]|uniref:ATP-binding protein n=1 Tax=Streptomyces resistomycificus TaxID=67356 RepID=UPI0007C432D7
MGSHADGDGCTAPDEYLMRAGYALGGDDGCIADARHHAVTFLDQARTGHHLPVSERARDLTQLVVSELVTNARKYAPGPVLMELRITAVSVDIVVWDSEPTVPAARAADPDRICLLYT